MELTTWIGLIGSFAAVIYGIFTGPPGAIRNFWDLPSVYITIGGTLFSVILSFPVDSLKSMLKAVGLAFKKQAFSLEDDIDMIINIANVARKEGLLALENAVNDNSDPFLRKGIMLIVDGSDPELIKTIMETELDFMSERHSQAHAVLESAAALGPAYGMIGTLIGLINMLKQLNDVASLGPNMATALVTTFYGCMIANALCNPLAKKLKAMSAKELLRKEMLLEGMLSIQDGENPRIIREKLTAFMSRSAMSNREKTTTRNETREVG